MSITRTELIEHLSGMTVMEMVDLTRDLEETWGVSATPAPVTTTIAVPETEEQTEFDVVLEGFGEKKIQVIKTLRQLTPGLGLKEAKEQVESAPVKVREAVAKEDADEVAAKLKEAGADVAVR